jgi:hypothetical protein
MIRITYAVVVFFSGFAMVSGILIFVYVLAIVLDKLSCFNQSPDTLTPDELEERRTASDLTRRACLAGLLSSERSRVFRSFFEKLSLAYHKTNEEDDDLEAQKKTSQGKTKTDTPSTDVDEGDVKDRKFEIATEAKSQEDASATEMESEAQEEESGDAVCSICLTEYGTSLVHCLQSKCCVSLCSNICMAPSNRQTKAIRS